ncbi:bifunctional 5,10-methylenetetrahydrofolate dehydrogenase/5,10-methenyltetrahydrofolate cyclohydrolase [Candidatus Uhrbacteria bacterium]|nr:bifunctional 5,10-methylenetetrahydrofolate dehydrogenase/5,10-methenyltetrahydrofolate cyclohydrolase [Candidatus Uhrbacteria bacterium]
MHIIDGKSLAAKILDEQKLRISQSAKKPRLAVLLVGQDSASELYVKRKQDAAAAIGAELIVKKIQTASTAELVSVIEHWNEDSDINGILVQLPLPKEIDTKTVIEKIALHKDVDGFRQGSPVISPTHEAVLRLLNETPMKLSGSQAVILANSKTFADPLAHLLAAGGVSVDIWNPDDIGTSDKDRLKEEIDLLITAIGRPGFVHASMLRDDVVLIDIGTTHIEGKVKGDADFESFKDTDTWITPVPGGVGPMTVALLMRNLVDLAYTSSPSGASE